MATNSRESLVAFLPEGEGDGAILLLHVRTLSQSLKKFIFRLQCVLGKGRYVVCVSFHFAHLNESKVNLFFVHEGDAVLQRHQLLELPHFLLSQVSLDQT